MKYFCFIIYNTFSDKSICSIYKLGVNFGLASSDVTTGETTCTEFLGGGSFINLIDK